MAIQNKKTFLVAQTVKHLSTMRETWVRALGWEDSLEKGKATHSSIIAWRIPWIYSPWGRKESDMTEQLSLSYIILCALHLLTHLILIMLKGKYSYYLFF